MTFIKHRLKFTFLSIIALIGTSAFSKDLFAEKERIRLEVSKTISDPTLINEITEIRFKKEVLDKFVNVAQYPLIPDNQIPTNHQPRDCRQAIIQFPPVPCADLTNQTSAASTNPLPKNSAETFQSKQQVEQTPTDEPSKSAGGKLLIINSKINTVTSSAEVNSPKPDSLQDVKSTTVVPVTVSASEGLLAKSSNVSARPQLIQSSQNADIAPYASVGSSITLGIESKLNDAISARLQFSGTPSSNGTKTINGSAYQYESHDQSLGMLLDWYPEKSPLRLTGGLSLNNSSAVLNGLPNSIVNINGNAVHLGSDTYSIEYKLPKVTPYLGIGYSSGRQNESGLSFFGELGIRVAKYNATTTTSLINSQNIKASDLTTEMSSIQKSLYKWSFVPSAQIGLTYRFN